MSQRSVSNRCIVVCACIVAWAASADPAAAQGKISYVLTDEPDSETGGSWRVEVAVAGLSAADGALVFSPFGGGWPQDGSYLELIESEPPVAELDERGPTVRLSVQRWNGRARLAYRIDVVRRGSGNDPRYGILPARGDGYAFGYSMDALLRPNQAGQPVEAEVEVEVAASREDGVLVTGWGGRAVGRQRVRPDRPWGNAPIAFGEPRAMGRVDLGAFSVESFQFSRGPDATERTLELVGTLAPAIARYVGWPARTPSRVFLTDAMENGMASDYGLHLGVAANAPAGHELDPFFATTTAHELFHEWLGMRLHESHGSLVWFREGFTEYFSQWLTAAAGILPREHFADTLERYDRFARTGTSLGRVAFADPRVDWRDGDGPNELMAYRGGPVLALAVDVELRAAGHPGLLQLVREFLVRDEHVFPPQALEAWFIDNGLESFWRTAVAGLEVPAADASLVRAGFERTDVEIDVAYLGLQTVEEGPAWRIVAIDPQGPCARTGVRVGDLITGYFPDNGVPTRLRELSTPYTFGLARFTPGIEGTFLGIQRDGEEVPFHVDPELRRWGLRTAWRATEAAEAFFAFTPR